MPAAGPRIIKAREMMMRYYPSAVLASLVAIFVVVTCNQGTSRNLKLSFSILLYGSSGPLLLIFFYCRYPQPIELTLK